MEAYLQNYLKYRPRDGSVSRNAESFGSNYQRRPKTAAPSSKQQLVKNFADGMKLRKEQEVNTHQPKCLFKNNEKSIIFSEVEPDVESVISTVPLQNSNLNEFLEDVQQQTEDDSASEFTEYTADSTNTTTDKQLEKINEEILNLSVSQEMIKQKFHNRISNLKKKEAKILEKRNAEQTTRKFKESKDFCAAGDTKKFRVRTKTRMMANDSTINSFKTMKKQCFVNLEAQIQKIKNLDEVLEKLYQSYCSD